MKNLFLASFIAGALSAEVEVVAEAWPLAELNPATEWNGLHDHLKEFAQSWTGQKISSETIGAFVEQFADFLHSAGKREVNDPYCLLPDTGYYILPSWHGGTCEEACAAYDHHGHNPEEGAFTGGPFGPQGDDLELEGPCHGTSSAEEEEEEEDPERRGCRTVEYYCNEEPQLNLDQDLSSCQCLATLQQDQFAVAQISDPELPAGCLADSNDNYVFNVLKKSPAGCGVQTFFPNKSFRKACFCSSMIIYRRRAP